jgi:hypothetical protein
VSRGRHEARCVFDRPDGGVGHALVVLS